MPVRDILFIVLIACSVALTTFTVWFLIELIRILRGVSKTIGSIEQKLERIDEIIILVRDKLHDASGALASLTKVIASVVQFFAQRHRRKSKTNTDDF